MFAVASVSDAKWTDEAGDFQAEVFCQLPERTDRTCTGDETYEPMKSAIGHFSEFSGRFLDALGPGVAIASVVEVSRLQLLSNLI